MVKKLYCHPKVVNNVLPELTSISFSSLINILTGPDGSNLDFTPKSIATKMYITKIKIIVLTSIYVKTLINYNFIPIKLIKPKAINPVIIKVIPKPFNGAGTLE